MKCQFLLYRHKQSKIVFFCKYDKKYISTLDECKTCLKRKYKRIKYINKASSKKEHVTRETYEIVFNRDNGMCQLCGTSQNLHLHHINGRGKGLTNNVNNCIMLCSHCHLDIVHQNLNKYRPILHKIIERRLNGNNNFNNF